MASWEAHIKKWVDRLLLDPGWQVSILASESLDQEGDIAHCSCWPRERRATILYSPTRAAEDGYAAHEVIHILLSPLVDSAREMFKKLGDGSGLAEAAMEARLEDAVDVLVRVFQHAYKEADDGPG